ncbi:MULTISPECIES: collagen-like protein [Sorangium]|uniref:Uncharacterized protein n=1 Tax=Sorangium cellulosum TaxID=56 RepID=A0A4P2R6N9_SORCE|nr:MULTISPECIES: collagen-like protein [Sorangium]AUX38516.1 uncharacterized protein SOCE836_107600 [Sorangium cellulosum]WCQ97802.1 hypothetical protein NQZ70_10600 [Sorangium sp. Soce836]
MNASIHRMHVTLGAAALLALVSGCGGQRRPAQPIGRTPTFESEVPYAAEGQPPGERQGQGAPGERQGQGAPGERQGQGAPGERQGQGAPGERQGQGAPGERQGQGAPVDHDERELCEEISASTSVSAQDIPGGVQIVLTPVPGATAMSLERLARRLDAHLAALDQEEQPSPQEGEARCRLFDMARAGAHGRVVEAADGIRLLFTTDDTASVSTLREQARRFVQYAREGQVR